MRKVPPGAFFALLPHMEGLSDYEMPQKVAQNDGLALLLKMVCRTSHKKNCRSGKNQYMLKKPVSWPSLATDAPFTGRPRTVETFQHLLNLCLLTVQLTSFK